MKKELDKTDSGPKKMEELNGEKEAEYSKEAEDPKDFSPYLFFFPPLVLTGKKSGRRQKPQIRLPLLFPIKSPGKLESTKTSQILPIVLGLYSKYRQYWLEYLR